MLGNDYDADGHSMDVIAVTQPSNGSVWFDATSVTYTGNQDWNGTDSFDYTVADGHGGTDTATVTVDVQAQDDNPVAVWDYDHTSQGQAVIIDLLANDSDAEGAVTLLTVDSPSCYGGTVVDNQDGTVTYTPAQGYMGIDNFMYNIEDGTWNTAFPLEGVAHVYVTDPNGNDAPWGVPDTAATDEDTAIDIDVLANDYDPEGGMSVVSIGSCDGVAELNLDGTIHYTPAPDFHGTDHFAYWVSDGSASGMGYATIVVRPANDAPVAVDDEATGTHGAPIGIDATGNDTDVDDAYYPLERLHAKIVSEVTEPGHGTAWFQTDPWTGYTAIYYQADADYTGGTDTFEYTMVDGHGGSDTATVSVNVVVVDLDISVPILDVLSEEAEDSIGGLVVKNADGNGAPRQQLILQAVTPASWAGNVQLTKQTCQGDARVFTAATGGQEITFSGVDNVFASTSLPLTLYVEGSLESYAMRDLQFTLQTVGAPWASDSVTFTVLWVNPVSVTFTGTLSETNGAREAYRATTWADDYALGPQDYRTGRWGWGLELRGAVHPADFSHPYASVSLDRDWQFRSWDQNHNSAGEEDFSAQFPPGNDTGNPATLDDDPAPDGTIYEWDQPGYEVGVSPVNSILYLRHNFRVCAVATAFMQPIRASLIESYFVRFSIEQVDAPQGSEWVLIDPPVVSGDNQTGLGSTVLTWNLQ